MNPLEFIQSVLDFDTVGDIKKLFTKRYCYGFALMMKQQFKDGILYWDRYNAHAIIKIDGKFYDIHGEYQPMNYDKLEQLDVVIMEGIR